MSVLDTDRAAAPLLGDWLAREPYTLGMSSGFFSFFAHCGLLSALEQADLLPQAVTGSSAGALTGGLWAAGLSAGDIAELYFSLRKHDFWDPAPGPWSVARRTIPSVVADDQSGRKSGSLPAASQRLRLRSVPLQDARAAQR